MVIVIARSLLQNKSTWFLLSCQVAITLAVLINAIALVKRSNEIIAEPTGMELQNIITIRSIPFDAAYNDESYMQARMREDLEYLRQYPAVINASASNSFPGDFGSNSEMYALGADEKSAIGVGVFMADENLIPTLGLNITSGRNFRSEEIFYSNWPSSDKELPQIVIITDSLARNLFPDESAIGKTVVFQESHRTVVGVTSLFRGRSPLLGAAAANAFFPGYVSGARQISRYAVRVSSGEATRLIPELETALLKLNSGRDIDTINLLLEHVEAGNGLYSYGGLVLLTISAMLVITTALGTFAITYLSVAKRTRQIGIRRALGATRRDILNYFLLENLVTTGSGILLGVFLAIGLNMLMTRLGLGRADWLVTGGGILFIALIGQLAVFVPAYLGSRIAPAVATRT